jgi:quinol monooxygenase YgiN
MATQTVFFEIQLKPDDMDAAREAVHTTLEQTRNFEGAISVDVLVDDEDPTRMIAVELWETADAHTAYLAWRATPEGASTAFGAVLAGRPVTRTFTTAEL